MKTIPALGFPSAASISTCCPIWEASLGEGMDREFGKEILKCFWIHCNTAYDAMIRNGHQGITSGSVS